MNDTFMNYKGDFITNLKSKLIKLIARKTTVIINANISIARSIPYDEDLGLIMVDSVINGAECSDDSPFRVIKKEK